MAAVLIHGSTLRSPEMRHEVPLAVGDPFLYLEADGRRAVLTNALEVDRIAAAVPDVERLLVSELGQDELIAEGRSYDDVEREVCVRRCSGSGSARRWCRPASRSRWPTACAPWASG